MRRVPSLSLSLSLGLDLPLNEGTFLRLGRRRVRLLLRLSRHLEEIDWIS